MKILQANAGLLTNSEVLKVLEDRGCGPKVDPNARSLASEKMVYQHLSQLSVGVRTPEEVKGFMEALAPFDLTRIERMQLANLGPDSVVEVHLIVEQCEERLTEEQVDAILQIVSQHLPRLEAA